MFGGVIFFLKVSNIKKWLDNFIYVNRNFLFPHKIMRPMIKYIKENGNKNNLLMGVEIGSDRGYNLKNIYDNLHIKKLYAIDITFKNLVYRNRRIDYIERSSDAAKNFIPNDLDFVYIDGDHSRDMVFLDIKNYYPKVKKGGVIGGHDFKFFSVRQGVYSFFDIRDVFVEGVDWWVVKK